LIIACRTESHSLDVLGQARFGYIHQNLKAISGWKEVLALEKCSGEMPESFVLDFSTSQPIIGDCSTVKKRSNDLNDFAWNEQQSAGSGFTGWERLVE
jgi:hypothetical protein